MDSGRVWGWHCRGNHEQGPLPARSQVQRVFGQMPSQAARRGSLSEDRFGARGAPDVLLAPITRSRPLNDGEPPGGATRYLLFRTWSVEHRPACLSNQ
jgi:hypothetical protein